MKEADLQKQTLEWFSLQRDCFAIRINTQGVPLHGREGYRPSPMRGVADILACVSGRFLAIELKSDRGRLSEEQKFFLERVQIAGGFAMEARSLDEIIQMVELIRETTRLSVPVHAD